ncbi:hypothetical protein HAX54_040789 [Datura stramonium]|uniref:DUF4220 domain-containing protein n=1 Tax=Datura stramonium TaxID=4076 RepID=A0ABS8RNU5_DATST|nr:hypothetical protein [Datura stramonium]
MSINDIKAAWVAYNVQSFCILSLLIQALLLLLAPFRKTTGSKILMVLVWLAYMAADWAPAFILNLIINYSKTRRDKADFMSFWASCMLLHLGGSDHVIAFSLEDNDLWFRYAFSFVFLLMSSAYVFYLSFAQVNYLWIPNVLVFLAGIIKCYERARARFIGSMDKSVTLSHPKYEQVVKRTSSHEPHNFRAREPDDVEVIQLAYAVYRAYKGVLVEHKFTFEEYGRIRQLLQNRTDLFAFRIAQAELEILHDVLYTKAQIFHESFGNAARSVYWVLLAAALASFSLLVRNNKQFVAFDVGVTYSLLIGGMCLDAIAFVVLLYSSTFTIATMSRARFRPITWVVKFLKILKWPRPRTLWCWKPSLQQFNLINYGLNRPSKAWECIIDFLHLTYYLDEMKYVENKSLSPILEAEILKQVEMRLNRHDWDCNSYASTFTKCTNKLPVSKELNKNEFLIVWHIVTEIFFNVVDGPEANIECDLKELNKFRQCSKSLSDYMFYILIFRPFFMPVPNKKKIEETNHQIKKLLHGKKRLGQQEACQEIMKNAAEGRIPHESFLYEAFKVVKCLQNESPWCQDRVKCWEIIHKTWIAILFDAAKCSAPRAHAQYLVRGGEILSLIWLLGANCGSMAQFAFFEDSDEENQTSYMARLESIY